MTSLGATITPEGVRFAVWSGGAERIWVCLFDGSGEREIGRLEMKAEGEGIHTLFMPDLKAGAKYGLRADGPFAPERGLWLDPDKLLVDPYAVEIDRPYRYDPRLAARRGEGGDTAALVPKGVAVALPEPVKPAAPLFAPGGLIYELSVRAFTMRHPDVPEKDRGTIRALAHPAIIGHLKKLGVSTVELMPITAWIDERHLGPLGLTNAWGYNPVTFMALDPRLAPGGLADLRATVAALREAGIGVILDLVFNHTGESDVQGPTLSLRGLDNPAYYRHRDGKLVNDTGTGNTVACDYPAAQRLILDSLRHFVLHAGVDGFRFDLAPVLGRSEGGFSPDAPLLKAMRSDPVLADRILIAEPWDIGPRGYQLGNFRPPFLEWNDKYRDDIRRFWRGDASTVGALATRLAGSSDVFAHGEAATTRSVNFVAAHDGMTLTDIARYAHKHNEANGEDNRDGHDENLSWNNGVEGDSGDSKVVAARDRDVRAMLATLFASRGAIMLTAGDEFGRTQRGNNNAYAQDNETTWLDWQGRDKSLEDFVCALSVMRGSVPWLSETAFLTDHDAVWLTETGMAMQTGDWQDPERRRLVMILGPKSDRNDRLAVLVNGDRRACVFTLPSRQGHVWRAAMPGQENADMSRPVPGRSVRFLLESPAGAG